MLAAMGSTTGREGSGQGVSIDNRRATLRRLPSGINYDVEAQNGNLTVNPYPGASTSRARPATTQFVRL